MRNYIILAATILFLPFGTSCKQSHTEPSVALKAFEELVAKPVDENQIAVFVDTYVNPASDRKERWISYVKQVLTELGSSVDLGEPNKSNEYVYQYRPKNAAVGQMLLTIIFQEKSPHYIKSIVGDVELGTPKASNTKPLSEGEKIERIEQKLSELFEKDEFSGAVLIAKDGKPVFKKAYGLASKSFDIPNNIDTKFNLASIGKSFTAVAIAQLVEQGKLSFNDKIIDVLPNYPNKEVAEKVTIHQLLTHTSGLGSFWNDKYYAQWSILRDLNDYLDLFVADDLQFEPGTKFFYSNSGYIVLGLIIEKVTGTSYFDYVKKNIYERAAMVNTDAFELDRPVKNRAIGYTRSNRFRFDQATGPRRNNLLQTTAKGTSAGGSYSTVEDMLNFINHIQSNKLITPKMKETLLTGESNISNGDQYGYGFHVYDHGSIHSYGHGGGAQGISTSIRFFSKENEGYAYVILSNYDNTDVESWLVEILLSAPD